MSVYASFVILRTNTVFYRTPLTDINFNSKYWVLPPPRRYNSLKCTLHNYKKNYMFRPAQVNFRQYPFQKLWKTVCIRLFLTRLKILVPRYAVHSTLRLSFLHFLVVFLGMYICYCFILVRLVLGVSSTKLDVVTFLFTAYIPFLRF